MECPGAFAVLGILLGGDGDLDDPVQPVLKDPVGFLDVLQLVAVGDQTGGVQLSFFNERKDLPAVAAVHRRIRTTRIPPDGRDIEITLDLPCLLWRIEGYLISLVGSAIYITSYFLQIEETRRVLLHTP